MKYLYKLAPLTLLASAAGLTLAGCGGGGDGSQQANNQQQSPFPAQGFWGGPAASGKYTQPYSGQTDFWDTSATDMGLVVLPTGETWRIDIVYGIVNVVGHGQTQVTGSSVTVNVTSFDSTSTSSGSIPGSLVPQSQLDLVSTGPLLLHYPTIYDARYEQHATLAQLAGTYAGTGDSGSGTYYSLPASSMVSSGTTSVAAVGALLPPAAFSPLSSSYTVTISNVGAVTLPPDPLGCGGAGTATPRTDSNVFNLSIRFSGSQCVLGNGTTVNGIAVVENGHLLMMAIPPSGSNPSGEFVYVSN